MYSPARCEFVLSGNLTTASTTDPSRSLRALVAALRRALAALWTLCKIAAARPPGRPRPARSVDAAPDVLAANSAWIDANRAAWSSNCVVCSPTNCFRLSSSSVVEGSPAGRARAASRPCSD